MEVAAPIVRSPDIHFNNTTFSPYANAPSSAALFGLPLNYQHLYTSAPASPARAPAPTSPGGDVFEFAFSPVRYPPTRRWSAEMTTADKLFENGRIRPLQQRGRNSLTKISSSNGQRISRSLSPTREEEILTKSTSPSANPVKCGLSRKWPRLRDLLLFRSASEGRVTGRGSKDHLKKYTILNSVSSVNTKRAGEDKKTGGGGEAGRRESRSPVSAHEKHYTANRAAAEEQKRKTPLPFQRHGLLGFVDFSPVIRSKNKVVGTSSMSRGRF